MPKALDRDPGAPITGLTEREELMLEVLAAVTRKVQELGVQATREQILQWARAGFQASLEVGRVDEAAIGVLVKFMR